MLKKYSKFLLIYLCLIQMNSCSVPLEALYNEIIKYQYIPYTTPLGYSGVGTIVGGNPMDLSLVAPPQRCFPDLRPNPLGDELEKIPTELRVTDETALPKRDYQINVDIKMMVKLFNFLRNGNPTMEMGFDFQKVKRIKMEMIGAKVVYMDTPKVIEYYQQYMSESCKALLDHVPVIIQALRVDELHFEFFNETGGRIYFDLQNIDSVVDIKADIKYSIVDNTVLNIQTPKYIGYQVGALRRKDNGLALYRATKTVKGKFFFENIGVFNRQKRSSNSQTDSISTVTEDSSEVLEILKSLDPDLFLEQNAVFSIKGPRSGKSN